MALTVAQLAVALRIQGDVTAAPPTAISGILTRQMSVARALVMAHASTAPEDVRDEAVIRLVGFLYDQDPSRPRSDNPFVASGAGAVLAPWHVQRIIVPSQDAMMDVASGLAFNEAAFADGELTLTRQDGSTVVVAIAAGGGGGLTTAQRETLEGAVQVDGITWVSPDLTFRTDGGQSHGIDLDGRVLPDIEAADANKVLKVNAAGTTADWADDETAAPGSGLDQAAVDARVNALVPAKRRVPTVGAGDVGRILTAPQSEGGQPTWNSNPGQTAAQVAARVAARVADWAETGNHDRIPELKLPQKVDDFADALSGGGYQNEGSTAADDAFVSTTFATAAKPANVASSFAYASSLSVSPRYTNVYLVIRVPVGIDVADLRLFFDATDNPAYYPGSGWTFVELDAPYNYYTQLLADAPVGVTLRVQRYQPFTLDGPAVGVESWATVGSTDRLPRNKVPESAFVTELLDGVRGVAVVAFNRAVQQTLQGFSPTALTLAASDHGVLLVSVQASVPAAPLVRLGDTVTASVQAYLSVLRGQSAYAGDGATKGNGTLVATFDVHNVSGSARGAKQGEIKCYVARNASNEVGTYAVYDPVTSPSAGGAAAGSVSLNWEVTLLRTDASAAAAPGGGGLSLTDESSFALHSSRNQAWVDTTIAIPENALILVRNTLQGSYVPVGGKVIRSLSAVSASARPDRSSPGQYTITSNGSTSERLFLARKADNTLLIAGASGSTGRYNYRVAVLT